ncbi:MAG: hypothetical protein IJQ66_02550 [Clostridia bacterium]|nr:hypothetical protein [Clostridia bacterium]
MKMVVVKRVLKSKAIARVLMAALIVFSVAFTAVFAKDGINANGLAEDRAEYKGIITLWHIDTFEGGTGSRKQFLNSVSRGFEKKNQGVLTAIVEHTAESAEMAMAEGRFPDLISYGAGVKTANLKEIGVSAYCAGGGKDGEIYAVPWCRGGYCIIENPEYKRKKNKKTGEYVEDPIIVSVGENTNPLLACAISGRKLGNYVEYAPMDAYVNFVSGKSRYFVGTQRDINRLNNRGMDFISQPISGYNDLFQYISITTNDQTKYGYAEKFVEYLIGEEVQKRLSAIGMLSCYYQVEYEDPDMKALQSAVTEYCPSAFATSEERELLREMSATALAGDSENMDKIKKVLVKS